MACLPCLTPYIIPAIAGTTFGISTFNKSKKRRKNQKAGKYTRKYINNLTNKQIRGLSDKDLLKYKKLYKIKDRNNSKPYTPKQVASIIIKKKSKTKKKEKINNALFLS